jgi:caffeoyl-CoA O-methyltransferase
MAEALPAGGSIITCDQDKAAAEVAKSNFASHPDGYKVSIHVGDALEALEAFEKTQVPAFDIVFIDADKSRYSQYFERLVAGPVLRSGGTIIVDNVLWKGSAPSDDSNQDWRSNALAQFNDYVASDPRVEVVVLPIREGLSLIRKL